MENVSPVRLDIALVRRGLARSRAEAQELIHAGQVTVAGRAAAKPRLLVTDTDPVEVSGARRPFVSRAGLKLDAALQTFAIAIVGRRALDVGASTGGFSDCLLQRGIACVDAVDVGHGQLAPSLAAEPRLRYREGVNARHLSPADFEASFDIIVADVSFISLTLILPGLPPLLAPGGDIVCLVKPQFEVGQAHLNKHGVVQSTQAQAAALARVRAAGQAASLCERGWRDSPILGGDGNREFLLWLRAGEAAGGSE